MKKFLKNEKGFTLVEMVVVMALVAILAAIAIPLYADYSARGRAKEANSIMGQLLTAADVFRAENGSYAGFGSATTNSDWPALISRANYFGYVTSGEGAAAITITASVNATGTGAGIEAGSSLVATATADAGGNPVWGRPWTATGDCNADYL